MTLELFAGNTKDESKNENKAIQANIKNTSINSNSSCQRLYASSHTQQELQDIDTTNLLVCHQDKKT